MIKRPETFLRNSKLLLPTILLLWLMLLTARAIFAYDRSAVQLYLDKGNYEEAIACLQKEIAKNPGESDIYADMGMVFETMGDYAEAIKWYEKTIEVNPGNAEGYYGLGSIYRKRHEYDQAIKWYKEALRLRPGDSDIYADIGKIYESTREYDEAIKWYKEAMRINPLNYHDLGSIYLQQRNFEEALKLFDNIIRLNPGDSDVYLYIGNVYREMGKYEEAIEWLNKGRKICQDCTRIEEAIARIYIKQGRYNEAESLLTSIVEGDNIESYRYRYWGCPFQALGEVYSHMTLSGQKKRVLENYMKAADIESYETVPQFQAAQKCYEYGDYANANKYIDRAISFEKNPEVKRDYKLLKGYILINTRKYQEAEDIFREVMEKGTQMQVARAGVGMGHIEITKRNYEVAERYFQKMFVLDGQDVMANLGMAWLSSNKNEHQRALGHYETILQDNPSYILALLGKGNALMGLKRMDEAEAIFEEVLRIEPDNEYVLAELGIVAYNKREDTDAEQLFKKSLSKNDQTHTCPYEGLGLLYLRRGKIKEAEENFRKAININPDIEYKKYNGLAKIYIKQRKYDEARDLLLKSIRNYPYDNEAKELLQELEAKM